MGGCLQAWRPLSPSPSWAGCVGATAVPAELLLEPRCPLCGKEKEQLLKTTTEKNPLFCSHAARRLHFAMEGNIMGKRILIRRLKAVTETP